MSALLDLGIGRADAATALAARLMMQYKQCPEGESIISELCHLFPHEVRPVTVSFRRDPNLYESGWFNVQHTWQEVKNLSPEKYAELHRANWWNLKPSVPGHPHTLDQRIAYFWAKFLNPGTLWRARGSLSPLLLAGLVVLGAAIPEELFPSTPDNPSNSELLVSIIFVILGQRADIDQVHAAEEIGWVGAVCIIAGYALTSFHIISVDSAAYHILNLIGAAGIIIVAYSHHTKQTIVVSSIRGVIAMGSLGVIAVQSF